MKQSFTVSQKYRKTLLFKVTLNIKSLHLRLNKKVSLFFEIVDDKKMIASKQFHIIEKNSPKTSIKERIELPIHVFFDQRKKRFLSKTLTINILNNHSKFTKKMGVAVLQLSQILNTNILTSKERLLLTRCSCKNAFLDLTTRFEFKGQQKIVEQEPFSHSNFSINTIRKPNKQRQGIQHDGKCHREPS